MNDTWLRFILAITVPLTFVLVLIGAAWRDREISDVLGGGFIAILGAIVALFSTKNGGKNDDEPDV